MEAFFSPFTVAIAGIIGVFSCGLASIITDNMRKTAIRKAEEESRRDIAAFVAEGSMNVEEGERLLNAGHHDAAKKR